MDLEFYNYTFPPTGGRRLLVPAHRLLRRLLRPSFHRLRDVLAVLWGRQNLMTARLTAAEAKAAALEETVEELAAAHRALALDHLALVRRVVAAEADGPARPAERPLRRAG